MAFDNPPARSSAAEHDIDLHVGRRLRLLRKAKGLGQEALAGALGITFQQVQKYENGVNRLSASRMLEACRFLGVAPNDLFEGLPTPGAAPETPRQAAARAAYNTAEGQALMAAFNALAPNDRLMLRGMALRLAQGPLQD